jgi:hypothetical protein
MAKLTDKELETLGRKLVSFYETGYINKKQTLWWSFLKGLAGGLGAFLGGTLVIGLIAWLLGFFDNSSAIRAIIDSISK